MKIRVLILTSILCCHFSEIIHAREWPRDEYGNIDYSNWDWQTQTRDNWTVEPNLAIVKQIPPPFAPYSECSELMSEIRDTYNYETSEPGDWTYDKGWRLIYVNLEGNYPHFILYNVNNSLLRAFIYTVNDSSGPFSSLAFSLKPTNRGVESKVFSYANSQLTAVNDNRSIEDGNITIFTKAAMSQWAAFETPMLFDNTIGDKKNANYTFTFYTCDNFDLKFEINGRIVANAGGNTIVSHQQSIAENQTFSAQYSKIHKQIKNLPEWSKELTKQADKIKEKKSLPSWVQNFASKLSNASSIANIAGTVAGISSGINVVAGILDFFMGSSSSPQNPTSYGISLNGAGTISINRALRGNNLTIPGSGDASTARVRPWEYNCHMGLFNIENAPLLYCYKFDGIRYISRSSYAESDSTDIELRSSKNNIYGNGYAYHLSNDINFNIKDDIQVIDIEVALLVKEDNSTSYVDELHRVKESGGNRYYNNVYDKLKSGKYIIYQYEETGTPVNNGTDGLFEYGTPYRSINDIKDMQIAAYKMYHETRGYKLGLQDISLGAIIKYKHKDDPSNTIRTFKGKWKCEIKEVSNSHEGLLQIPIYRYNMSKHIALDKEYNSVFSAGTIRLKPGFVGRPGFRAEATFTEILNRSQSFYYEACNATTIMPNVYIVNENAEIMGLEANQDQSESDFSLYPNPTDGLINLNIPSEYKVSKIEIYSMYGKRIVSNNYSVNPTEINLTGNTTGIYVLRIHHEEGVYEQKIVLK